MNSITICGIEVKVVRKRIKNMYLRINKNGEVVLSAPITMPFETIAQFVYSKEEWLIKALDRVEEKKGDEPVFCEGEERSFLGKKYTLHIDTTKKSGYYFRGNDIVLCVGENSTVESRRKALVNVYREAMNEILPEIAQICQEK